MRLGYKKSPTFLPYKYRVISKFKYTSAYPFVVQLEPYEIFEDSFYLHKWQFHTILVCCLIFVCCLVSKNSTSVFMYFGCYLRVEDNVSAFNSYSAAGSVVKEIQDW